jgi:hypothetical protein
VPVRFALVYQDQRVPLRDGVTVVGRSMSCNVRFNAPTVSRQHLILEVDGEDILAENLSSSMGTLLNGKKLTEKTPVHAGDLLTLGPREIRIERAEESSQFTAAPPSPALGLLPDGDDDDITLTEDVASPRRLAGVSFHTCPSCRTQVPFDRSTCPSCGHVWRGDQASAVVGQITSKNVHDDVKMPSDLPAVYASEELTLDVVLTDLRRDGAFVPTELLDAPGTRCELTLLPEGQAPLTLTGTVASARAVASGKGPAGMELKFAGMTEGTRLWLDLWAKRKKS